MHNSSMPSMHALVSLYLCHPMALNPHMIAGCCWLHYNDNYNIIIIMLPTMPPLTQVTHERTFIHATNNSGQVLLHGVSQSGGQIIF